MLQSHFLLLNLEQPGLQRKILSQKQKQSWVVVVRPFSLGRQRQVVLCEFKASVVYIASSRTVIYKNLVLENKNKKTNPEMQKLSTELQNHLLS